MAITTPTLTNFDLQQFTGTAAHYRHGLNRKITYTDGVRYMAEAAGAYWLIDEIALRQTQKLRNRPERISQFDFQQWTLVVKGNKASLTLEDGSKNRLYSKRIEYTDFPLDEIKLWVEGGVILLPSEH